MTSAPLDDTYSFDAGIGGPRDKAQNKAHPKRGSCALNEDTILKYLIEYPHATQLETAKAVSKSRRTVQGAIAALKEKGLLAREGARKTGRWVVRGD
ncbi:MAG: winged helix-turn-helix domain-containing protein [Methylobacteriaceae bacterium]|nr:winged helix-turn-helix domain-containing protein [Methylobacteriaceae bacterium]